MSRKPEQNPFMEIPVSMYFLNGRNASICMLIFHGRRTMWFTGEAKREPGDQMEDQIALDLSLSRALRSAGEYYSARAAKAVIRNSLKSAPVQKKPSASRLAVPVTIAGGQ